jgi:ubiquinone/menaquinone biosynthesis C-methylase UbiE
MQQSDRPNMQQAANWNEGSGKTWVDLQPLLDGVLAPFERLLVDAGHPGEGGRVLDVGCGAGATTLAMALCVGSSGRCVGLDISEPLVALARKLAEAQGAGNVEFVVGDAQTHTLQPGRFEARVSRFGVMFFDDPVAAFANIRQSARPGARMAFFA